MTSGAPRRVVVVGFGPKSLFALDHLARAASDVDAQLRLDIFEPHPVIGAGPVYDPRQPRCLRMNFASKHVDAGGGAPAFVEWARRHDPEVADPEGFAPRASVGAYLHGVALRVLDRLSEQGSVALHPRRAIRVERDGDRWVVEGSDGRRVAADEVLIATGHGSRRIDTERRPEADGVVYPVARELAPERIPPGCSVAIRGMGLTALDAVVVLSRRPPELRPERVLLFSRTGRPMLPKLAPEARYPDADEIVEAARDAMLRAGSVREFGRALVQAASDLLGAMGRHPHAAAAVLHVLMTSARRSARRPLPRTALRRGIAIARGERCWNAERALGEAWRTLYPTVVEWHGRHDFARRERSTFRRLCRELERLAFGPPLEVAETLMHGVDDGWVDLSVAVDPALDPSASGWTLRADGRRREADRLVDAVLVGPGIAPSPSPLFRSLLHAGHVRVRDGWHGAEVMHDATAIGSDGTPSAGLSLIGRPTEGCVLGNDTLNRSLHAHPSRWAHRVVAGALPTRSELQPS